MTRITFVGTCLAALVATAMFGAAATEAAGTPEWYECIKAKGVGTYEKGCAKEGGAGGYVARPGIGTGSFVIQGKGKVVLRGANGTHLRPPGHQRHQGDA